MRFPDLYKHIPEPHPDSQKVLFPPAVLQQRFPVHLLHGQAVHQRSDHRSHRLPEYCFRICHLQERVLFPYPEQHLLQIIRRYSGIFRLHTEHILLLQSVLFLFQRRYIHKYPLPYAHPVLLLMYGFLRHVSSGSVSGFVRSLYPYLEPGAALLQEW